MDFSFGHGDDNAAAAPSNYDNRPLPPLPNSNQNIRGRSDSEDTWALRESENVADNSFLVQGQRVLVSRERENYSGGWDPKPFAPVPKPLSSIRFSTIFQKKKDPFSDEPLPSKRRKYLFPGVVLLAIAAVLIIFFVGEPFKSDIESLSISNSTDVESESSVFYINLQRELSYEEAFSFCQLIPGSQLADIRNVDEYLSIQSFLEEIESSRQVTLPFSKESSSFTFKTAFAPKPVYIGLYNNISESNETNNLSWLDGRDFSEFSGINAWAVNQPDKGQNSGQVERCVVYSPTFGYKWEDVDCSGKHLALCRVDVEGDGGGGGDTQCITSDSLISDKLCNQLNCRQELIDAGLCIVTVSNAPTHSPTYSPTAAPTASPHETVTFALPFESNEEAIRADTGVFRSATDGNSYVASQKGFVVSKVTMYWECNSTAPKDRISCISVEFSDGSIENYGFVCGSCQDDQLLPPSLGTVNISEGETLVGDLEVYHSSNLIRRVRFETSGGNVFDAGSYSLGDGSSIYYPVDGITLTGFFGGFGLWLDGIGVLKSIFELTFEDGERPVRLTNPSQNYFTPGEGTPFKFSHPNENVTSITAYWSCGDDEKEIRCLKLAFTGGFTSESPSCSSCEISGQSDILVIPDGETILGNVEVGSRNNYVEFLRVRISNGNELVAGVSEFVTHTIAASGETLTGMFGGQDSSVNRLGILVSD